MVISHKVLEDGTSYLSAVSQNMDPVSMTASVITITAACLSVLKSLDQLRMKLRYAAITISAIFSEAAVISTSLTKLLNLIT